MVSSAKSMSSSTVSELTPQASSSKEDRSRGTSDGAGDLHPASSDGSTRRTHPSSSQSGAQPRGLAINDSPVARPASTSVHSSGKPPIAPSSSGRISRSQSPASKMLTPIIITDAPAGARGSTSKVANSGLDENINVIAIAHLSQNHMPSSTSARVESASPPTVIVPLSSSDAVVSSTAESLSQTPSSVEIPSADVPSAAVPASTEEASTNAPAGAMVDDDPPSSSVTAGAIDGGTDLASLLVRPIPLDSDIVAVPSSPIPASAVANPGATSDESASDDDHLMLPSTPPVDSTLIAAGVRPRPASIINSPAYQSSMVVATEEEASRIAADRDETNKSTEMMDVNDENRVVHPSSTNEAMDIDHGEPKKISASFDPTTTISASALIVVAPSMVISKATVELVAIATADGDAMTDVAIAPSAKTDAVCQGEAGSIDDKDAEEPSSQ